MRLEPTLGIVGRTTFMAGEAFTFQMDRLDVIRERVFGLTLGATIHAHELRIVMNAVVRVEAGLRDEAFMLRT